MEGRALRNWGLALVLVAVLVFLSGSLAWSVAHGARFPFLKPATGPGNTSPSLAAAMPTEEDRTDGERGNDGSGQPDGGSSEPADLSHRQTVLERFACEDCHGPGRGWEMPQDEDHRPMTAAECQSCHRRMPEPPPVTMHEIAEDAADLGFCSFCHSQFGGHAPVAALEPTPAVARQAGDCSACHFEEGEKIWPDDHARRSSATCMVCHETEFMTVPGVPHRIAGWEECSFCHGEQRLTPLVGAHEDEVQNKCLDCHTSVLEPPDTHEKMYALSEEGEGCTSCHGENDLASVPASHEGRAAALCTLCHHPGLDEPPLIPHELSRQEPCGSCHGPDLQVELPASHDTRTEEMCETCHVEWPDGVPEIPHSRDNRDNCTDCHNAPPSP